MPKKTDLCVSDRIKELETHSFKMQPELEKQANLRSMLFYIFVGLFIGFFIGESVANYTKAPNYQWCRYLFQPQAGYCMDLYDQSQYGLQQMQKEKAISFPADR